MPHLMLKLLGSYHLSMDGHPITTIESDKARALLAYLAVEKDRPHPARSWWVYFGQNRTKSTPGAA